MSHVITNGLKSAFFIAITLFCAATSFLFFVSTFAVGGEVLSNTIATALLNGALGVLVLDFAALTWLRIYLNGSDNNTLRTIAIVGAVIGLVGSSVTSLAYLMLIASAGTFPETWRTWIQWALALIAVSHFVLVFLSYWKSTQSKIDEKVAEMLAEGTEEMLKLANQNFREALPGLAQQNANELTRMLAARFSAIAALPNTNTQPGPDPPHQPGPSPNGHMEMEEGQVEGN